jgi:hypothetical protein
MEAEGRVMESWRERLPDMEGMELKEGRKTMAFDVCFKAIYPNTTEDNMRACIQSYRRYTKAV